MKVRQLSTTNERFKKHNDKIGYITKYNNNISIKFSHETAKHTDYIVFLYTTSYVKNVTAEGTIITFETRNSTYVYEILKQETPNEIEYFKEMNLDETEVKELEENIKIFERCMVL